MDNSIEYFDFVICAFIALLTSAWIISKRAANQRRIQARLEQGKKVWTSGRYIASLNKRDLMVYSLGSCAVNSVLMLSLPFTLPWATFSLTHFLIFFGVVMCLSLFVPRLIVVVAQKVSKKAGLTDQHES